MPDLIHKKLKERIRDGNLRSLTSKERRLDFVSNDYLGLSQSRDLFEKIQSYSYEHIINLNGSTGSRLLAGNSREAMALEEQLASIFHAESTLLFNSGYMANLALLSCLPERGDTIIYDQLSHVCLKEGAWLGQAKTYSFRHNDCNDLKLKLKNAEGTKYVVIESVYSMDGDVAPFDSIIEICEKYDAKIIIDEAHGTGLYGTHGAGKVCQLGIEDKFFARVYTFGKAMGVHGACIAGSKQLTDYLINFARPFIYTTALPIHSIFSIDAAFSYLSENIGLQEESRKKIALFNSYFEQTISDKSIKKLDSMTPIQPIVIPGNTRVKSIASKLQADDFDVRPVLSPTVREGTERLRVSIHTHNTDEQIRSLIDKLASHL
jgi:8-amino-7-oxononanoate synthase